MNVALQSLLADFPLVQVNGERWRMQVGGLALSLWEEDGWLRLRGVPFDLPPSPWELLKSNARMAAAKFAAFAGHAGTVASGICMQAEIPLKEDVDLPLRVRQACQVMAAVAKADLPSCLTQPGIPSCVSQTSLDDAIAAAGFACRVAGGRTVFDLPARGGIFRADLSRNLQEVVVVAELCSFDLPLADVHHNALAIASLKASTLLRLAAIGVAESDDAVLAVVTFASPPSVSELVLALDSLQIACDALALELETLAKDRRLAETYLACAGAQGWQ